MLSFRFGSGSGGSSRMPAAPEEEPKDSELELSRGKDKSDVKKDDTTNSEAFYLYQKETNTLMKFFPELHGPERVVEVYSCSLNAGLSELQSQGSIYITGQYICFINTAGDIKEMIAFRDITDITKNATKMNTSIEISTAHAKLLFSFFLMRDKTLSMMTTIWKNRGKSNDQYTTLAASVKYAKENKTLHDLFPTLSTYETVLEHYSCSFGGNLQQGRMYITNFYCIYFYSSIPFIDDVKEQILFSQILAIEKISTSVIDNSIDIQTLEKRFSFKHFLTYRDECFSLLLSLWDRFKKRPRVFGTPLAELLLRENRGVSIPKFVEQAVTFLTASALNTEGLFRITPNLRDQEYLQFLIDDGENVDFFSCEDKHQIAGLLKKYFRDLPQPLFTYEFHNCFLALYESKQLYDPSELMRRLRDLLRLLPHHNRQLARYMMEFLSKVAGHVANNKMNPKNLATIWGTIFLKASESEEVDVYFLKQVSEIMDLTLIMINNYDLLFAE